MKTQAEKDVERARRRAERVRNRASKTRVHSTVSELCIEGAVSEADIEYDKLSRDMAEVADAICSDLDFKRNLLAEHQQEIRRLEREIKRIKAAVCDGRWSEIDSLCDEHQEILGNAEPVDRADLMHREYWL